MFRWLGRILKSAPPENPKKAESVVAPVVRSGPVSPAPEVSRPRDPELAQHHFKLSNQALARGMLNDAERHLRQAVSAQPDHVDALCNLGAVLKDLGQPDAAADFLERALKLQPRAAFAAFNLALLRIAQRRWGDALPLLETAASCQPKDADMHYWLGNARMGWGDAEGARKAYQAALRINPNMLEARWGLTMAQIPAVAKNEEQHAAGVKTFGREISSLRAWFRARPTVDGSVAVGAQQPYYLAYRDADHCNSLSEYGALCASLMNGWAKRNGMPAPVKSSGPKLKVGIVSAHLHSHSVWHALLRGWVEHLDPKQFELHLFHTGAVRDAETEWAARRVARLHHGASDFKSWVRLVVDSQLDVLLYPEIGMDSTTVRLASLRLARLQLASWGHPITSGLPTIDAYISAEAFEPEGAESHYSERLLTLPRLGCHYKPYGVQPAGVDFAAFGIASHDRVLLCPGTAFKYAPKYDNVWVEIARRCSPCKLVFFKDKQSSLSEKLQQRLEAAFAAAGLSAQDTLCFVPWQSQAAFFAFLDRADVFLDSIGFSGFNTAMQAVERSTPIVAYEGAFMRGRFASAILRQLGLDEWVADTPDRFIELVAKIISDNDARAAIRQKMKAKGGDLLADSAGVAEFGRHIVDMLNAEKASPG